jgi:hypothetical protein
VTSRLFQVFQSRRAELLGVTATVVLLNLIFVLAAGCGEVCEICGVPGAGTGNAPGSPPVLRELVSYGFDIQPIWDKNCVMCHRTGGIAQTVFHIPLSLTSGQARDDLINQSSVEDTSRILVIPGDADSSYLFQKVSDPSPPVGKRMPLFQPALLDDEIELIRRWIEQGAE